MYRLWRGGGDREAVFLQDVLLHHHRLVAASSVAMEMGCWSWICLSTERGIFEGKPQTLPEERGSVPDGQLERL